MQRAFYSIFSTLPLATIGCLIPISAQAQITPDNSLGNESSIVTPLDEQGFAVDRIDGGAIRGNGLFHSFQDFNVDVNRGAYFSNPDGINSIFSRVTGINPSNINGVLGVIGNADLFLINPNGIIFGQNARLDLNGSFFASTADSLLFEGNTDFSAANPSAAPLLEVSIPIGANFRDNPGDITNLSRVQNSDDIFAGLEVLPGNNITLLGGNVNFITGRATARGGNIELGGLLEAGTVDIGNEGNLVFPEDIAKADITLSDASEVTVQSDGGGSININAGNLTLETGEFGSSFIRGGILSNSTSPEAQAGDITVNSTGSVNIFDDSAILNPVLGGASGNSGNIIITTGSLFLNNGSEIFTETRSKGKAGDININASDINLQLQTKINTSTVGEGDGGNLILNTERLNLTEGAQVLAITTGLGEGGRLTVNASESITLSRGLTNEEGINLPSSLTTQAQGAGSAGELNISTERLIVSNGAQISAGTFDAGSSGNLTVDAEQIELIGSPFAPVTSGIFASTNGAGTAGNIDITTESLLLSQGAEIQAGARSTGKAGNININASDINLQQDTGISTSTVGEGDGGNLTLNTERLNLTDGAQILAVTTGLGSGGSLTINTSESITLNGSFINEEGVRLASNLSARTQGDGSAGELKIDTGRLTVRNGAQIDTSTDGAGRGGNLTIDAEQIELIGSSLAPTPTLISVSADGAGTGGNIDITTKSLLLSQGSEIQAEARSTGKAGNININASDINLQLQTKINTSTVGAGDGGNLTLNTERLNLTEGAQVLALTSGLGEGGRLTVNASESITLDGSFIKEEGVPLSSSLTTQAQRAGNGSAGELNISTERLIVSDGAQISAGTFGAGRGGNLTIDAEQIELIGSSVTPVPSGISVSADGTGTAGNIDITTESLLLSQGAEIQAEATSTGKAGNININASDINLQLQTIITASTVGEGDGGNLTLNTERLNLTEGAQVTALTAGLGKGGNLTVNASESTTLNGGFTNEEGINLPSSLSAQAQGLGDGSAGELNIDTGRLVVSNGAQISAGTQGTGNGGNLTIDAEQIELIGSSVAPVPSGIFVSTDGAGTGGNIGITTVNLFLFQGAEIQAEATSPGKAGNININASDINLQQETQINASTAGEGDGGNLILNTERLNLTDGAQVLAVTTGLGEGGSLTVNASESITLNGGFINEEDIPLPSSLSAQTQGVGNGSAGELNIDTRRLIVSNGAQISAGTEGTGNGGNLTVDAKQIELIGSSLAPVPSGIFASTEDTGTGGNINITTESLLLTQGAEIQAEATSTGKAGTVNIFANDSVVLNGVGGVSVQASNGGTAGNLNLETDKLTIADGALINVSSPEGQAGNLNISANSLNQNQGLISAETGLSEGDLGANINLEISDTWRIENESSVSATAFGDANGGNININQNLSDTEFLLFAFPSIGGNGSDISANAEQGNGGRIDITAAGVFGIDFRDSQTPLNDFTVSSEFGTSGETIINRTFEDPTSGLINLPASVGDASDQISQNPCQQGIGSQFIIGGKGGLPPNVNDSLNSEQTQVGLIEPLPQPLPYEERGVSEKETGRGGENTSQSLPAQGWVFNEKGEVTLTAYRTTNTKIKRSNGEVSHSCSALQP